MTLIPDNRTSEDAILTAFAACEMLVDYFDRLGAQAVTGRVLADCVSVARKALEEQKNSPEPLGDGSIDICGLCGQPGADKMALWTGGGIYWPGERVPETELVHHECEREETARAHGELTQEQRERFMKGLGL